MTVLRVYDPPWFPGKSAECDEHGVPLDWERCRCQREVPGGMGSLADAYYQRDEVCPDCGGYGSLRAAALAALHGVPLATGPVRCEDCGHPMSDGTWDDPDHPRAPRVGGRQRRVHGARGGPRPAVARHRQ